MIQSKLGPARAELLEASGDLMRKLFHRNFKMMSMGAPGIFWD
jgi:hypothetical protein